MAHEIKNPLVSIQTFVELLAEHAADLEFTEHFRIIVSRDIRAIDGITEKLVSFASDISYRFAHGDVQTVLQRLRASLTAEQTMHTSAMPAPNGSVAVFEDTAA